MWCTGVNIHNEIQDGRKGRIDKKGFRFMVGARQCPGLKGRSRAVRLPWTIYAFIHQSSEHEAASWHNGCCSHTLSLISPRTLKVKNISVMIMHCLFILSKAIFVSTKWARAKPSLLGCIKTHPHMHKTTPTAAQMSGDHRPKLLYVNTAFRVLSHMQSLTHLKWTLVCFLFLCESFWHIRTQQSYITMDQNNVSEVVLVWF